MASRGELETLIIKHNQVQSELRLTMNQCTEIGVDLEVAELEETIKAFVEMEQQINNHMKALRQLQDVRRTDNETPLVEIFKQKLKEAEKAQEKNSIQKHEKYREFRQKVWRVKHPHDALPEEENEELVVIQRDENFMCPLTRKELVSPMKNTMCGHVYSKEAIMQYIQTNKKKKNGALTCPVAGCNKTVDTTTLQEDAELERQMKRSKGKRKQPEASEEYTQL